MVSDHFQHHCSTQSINHCIASHPEPLEERDWFLLTSYPILRLPCLLLAALRSSRAFFCPSASTYAEIWSKNCKQIFYIHTYKGLLAVIWQQIMGYKISVLLWGSLELKCNPASWKWCHRLKLSKRTSVFHECLPFTRFWSSSFPTKCNTLLKKIYFFIAEGRGRGMSYASIFPVQDISHWFCHLCMCHFDTRCVVLFSDTMNCWPYIGACRWDKSTVLKVPMDKEFANI